MGLHRIDRDWCYRRCGVADIQMKKYIILGLLGVNTMLLPLNTQGDRRWAAEKVCYDKTMSEIGCWITNFANLLQEKTFKMYTPKMLLEELREASAIREKGYNRGTVRTSIMQKMYGFEYEITGNFDDDCKFIQLKSKQAYGMHFVYILDYYYMSGKKVFKVFDPLNGKTYFMGEDNVVKYRKFVFQSKVRRVRKAV